MQDLNSGVRFLYGDKVELRMAAIDVMLPGFLIS
jgi:hypothetical protein